MLVKSQGQKLRSKSMVLALTFTNLIGCSISLRNLIQEGLSAGGNGRSHPIFGVKTLSHDVPGDEVRFSPECV